MISLLPARIIKLLEFIGFSGDKVIKKLDLIIILFIKEIIHIKFYLLIWLLGIRSNGIESGLRRKERSATSPLCDDSAVL